MSKASELRLIRGQRSADAAINYHHRSGDSEGSGGSMLDYYAQEESAEAAYLEEEDESAREVFSRAFKLYLKKTLTGKERQFLSRVLSGKEKPQDVGRALGVKWFEYLQEIRRKAFNNAEAFGRVVQLSGWSRAEEFSGAVFGRLKELERRGTSEELPREKKQARARAMMKAFRESADEERRAATSFYNKKYYLKNLRQILELNRKWRRENREKRRAENAKYRAEHREELRKKAREYCERIKARDPVAYAEKNRAKSQKAYLENPEKMKAYQAANKEKIREYQKAYQAANREKIREYQKAYQAKKKAEKAAAQALAGLLILTQAQEAETPESVSAIE